MKKHSHDYQIILREVMPDGSIMATKECAGCGKIITDASATGDWIGARR